METLLRSERNNVSTERQAMELVQLIKYENSCTFSFSGYNNPIRQHQYHCRECDKDVCLVCAAHCHHHPELDHTGPVSIHQTARSPCDSRLCRS